MRGRAHIIGIICALLLCQAAWAQRTVSSIPVPDGFERVHPQGFGQYLQSFPLKPEGTPVRYFDGSIKPWQDGAFAVLDIDVGDKDLQQCADAVIRLRAEYLWKERLYQRIHFNFTNAFCADYDKWAQGYRIKIQGNKASWYNAAEEDYQYKTFRKYLDMVFSYAGTASLSKELISVQMADLTIGDIFIVGGHPDHALVEEWFDLLRNMHNFAVKPDHVNMRFHGILDACYQPGLNDLLTEDEKQSIGRAYYEDGFLDGWSKAKPRDGLREKQKGKQKGVKALSNLS